jgi:mannose-6-phosphate isomerase-like protein (cupin superfamily)
MPEFSLDPLSRRIEKPWGYEVLLSPADAPYAFKLIHVQAGKRLSLQVHDIKVETQTLVSGRGILVLEGPDGELHDIPMQLGVGYHVAVGQRHRLCAAADEDATVFEASSPEVGTTLRLEDDYARPHETEELRHAERAGGSAHEAEPIGAAGRETEPPGEVVRGAEGTAEERRQAERAAS